MFKFLRVPAFTKLFDGRTTQSTDASDGTQVHSDVQYVHWLQKLKLKLKLKDCKRRWALMISMRSRKAEPATLLLRS
ncbi:hypothetical protein PHLCEN_2v12989 [Hermanssonia centrifuga]|uniref:Uncharacterized protein n=1 Tax=Hermanssonia centrifuga TaxID=98765 RepID=A0A2R6NFJ4_9APHY|nr:hypothetical protein PHLCEN_2v12989 [Hermanssonia centrifuga]